MGKIWSSIILVLLLQRSPSAAEQARKTPAFQQYRVANVYHGKPAAPVFTTKEELEFRTRIRQGAAKGPNFAGHYAVVEWGGGTGTGTFVIVDEKTGRIFFHVDPKKGIGFFFNLDSRLMVIDGCANPPVDGPCVRSFWEWTGTEMKFLTEINPASSLGLPEGFVPPKAQ